MSAIHPADEPISDIEKYRQSSETLDKRDRVAILARLLAGVERPIIFDVGAGVGAVLKRYLDVFPLGEFHAFEAHPQRRRLLREAFSEISNVHLNDSAVGDRDGEVDFYVHRIASTSSMLPTASVGRSYMPSVDSVAGKIAVPCLTLDAYCRRRGIDRIDLLKLDIQGGESAALNGAAELLRAGRVRLIFMETFFVQHYQGALLFHELWGQLERLGGYSLYDLFLDRYARNGQLRFGDAIFVSPEFRREVLDAYSPEI